METGRRGTALMASNFLKVYWFLSALGLLNFPRNSYNLNLKNTIQVKSNRAYRSMGIE